MMACPPADRITVMCHRRIWQAMRVLSHLTCSLISLLRHLPAFLIVRHFSIVPPLLCLLAVWLHIDSSISAYWGIPIQVSYPVLPTGSTTLLTSVSRWQVETV